MRRVYIQTSVCVAMIALSAAAEPFELLIGVDAGRWPGPDRTVAPVPGSGINGSFADGDRLAGTADTGSIIIFDSCVGQPALIDPNEFGSLSFVFKRGTIPGGNVPFMGIDFLGGPLIDLDGDLDDGKRSLIPNSGAQAALMPGTHSTIDLDVDHNGGLVTLEYFDATSCAQPIVGIPCLAFNSINVIAAIDTTGAKQAPINPDIDTRVGSLTPFSTRAATLEGVYRIEDLGYEFWQDTLHNSTTANQLGTFQFLGRLDGWLIERDPVTGDFPVLSGEGLDSTRWPEVGTTGLNEVFTTAVANPSPTALIGDGPSADNYFAANNGGLALTDFGGDLGAYLDAVVTPLISPFADSYVYLSSAGFGINNSGDFVFDDTIAYDIVLVAQQAAHFDLRDYAGFQACFTGSGGTAQPECAAFDLDADGDVDGQDFAVVHARLTGPA